MGKIDQSREIALFIEKLRLYRNISQEDFLHDIISMRQYRRYMSGVSTLSYVVLDKLAKRLGFDAEFIIMELEAEKIKQTHQVIDLYNAIVSRDTKKASELFLKIDERLLISNNDRLLFFHSQNLFDYFNGHNSELVTINKSKKLLDFEKLLKKKALSSSELVILVSFFYFEKFKDIHIIAKKIASYMDNDIAIVTGHNIKIITLALEELSRYFSIEENYEKMLYYANEGIRYCHINKSYYLLDTLYYFAAAACHELHLPEKRNELLKCCMAVLFIEENKQKINHFTRLFLENFDVDVKSLF